VGEVGTDPGKLPIAYTTKSLIDAAVHTDCVHAIEDTAKLCADLGHEVEEAVPDLFLDPPGKRFSGPVFRRMRVNG